MKISRRASTTSSIEDNSNQRINTRRDNPGTPSSQPRKSCAQRRRSSTDSGCAGTESHSCSKTASRKSPALETWRYSAIGVTPAALATERTPMACTPSRRANWQPADTIVERSRFTLTGKIYTRIRAARCVTCSHSATSVGTWIPAAPPHTQHNPGRDLAALVGWQRQLGKSLVRVGPFRARGSRVLPVGAVWTAAGSLVRCRR